MSNDQRHDRSDNRIPPPPPDRVEKGYKPDSGKVPPMPVNTPPPQPSDSKNEKK